MFSAYNNNEIYKNELDELKKVGFSELELIKKEILLASKFGDFKKVIVLLNRQIQIEGESSELFYQLGGTNGIIASKNKNFFSIIYLNQMLKSFSKALDLDPNHVPTLEAYIEALNSVPKILGGDKKKAIKLAERLKKISKINGFLSLAMIHFNNENHRIFKFYLNNFFDELSNLSICESKSSKKIFLNKSDSFPIKISQVTSFFEREVQSGLCALDFYLKKNNFEKNLFSLDWIYYLKSKLLFLNGNNKDSFKYLKLSLKINPEFELSNNFLKKNF